MQKDDFKSPTTLRVNLIMVFAFEFRFLFYHNVNCYWLGRGRRRLGRWEVGNNGITIVTGNWIYIKCWGFDFASNWLKQAIESIHAIRSFIRFSSATPTNNTPDVQILTEVFFFFVLFFNFIFRLTFFLLLQ